MPEVIDLPTRKTRSAADTLGGRIQRARLTRGLTVSQLARRAGILTKTLDNWERDRSAPRANKLNVLAGALGVPVLWLLGGGGEEVATDAAVTLNETANLRRKLDRLLDLHQQSATLLFELDSEIRRLQLEIDKGSVDL